MNLVKTKNKDPGQKLGRWRTLTESIGRFGYQVHKKDDTYLIIATHNTASLYEMHIPPDRIKVLRDECDRFLKTLEEQGWDM